jgi:hypothetical protein
MKHKSFYTSLITIFLAQKTYVSLEKNHGKSPHAMAMEDMTSGAPSSP